MSAPTQVFLQVRSPQGLLSRIALAGQRMVVGRSNRNEIRLDSSTVSRQHAELYRDPFDRWWIRDLGSRNGTKVNGVRVKEQILQPGDLIEVEEFTLDYEAAAPALESAKPDTNASLTITDGAVGRTRRLAEFAPPKIDAAHISSLSELGNILLTVPSQEQRLKMLCALLVKKEFHGINAVVLRVGKQPGSSQAPQLLCEPARADGIAAEPPYVSNTVLREVLAGGVGVVASNAAPRTGVVEISLAEEVREFSAVACPLRSDEAVMDILYVTLPAAYGSGEWLALADLAAKQHQQGEAAWQARVQAQDQAAIQRELERARQIQFRLVPQHVQIPGLEVAVEFEPCRWVGGDYVDVVPIRDGRILLTIADVCGKGLQAALITACLHTMIHSSAGTGMPLSGLMHQLETYLRHTLPEESFVTMICVLLDPATGELECSNAGHPPAMLVSPRGVLRDLPWSENLPLGLGGGPPSTQKERIAPGEMLTLYTDGLTELSNDSGEMLGLAGMGELLRKVVLPEGAATASGLSQPLRERARLLREHLRAFNNDQVPEDDCTFLMVRLCPASGAQ